MKNLLTILSILLIALILKAQEEPTDTDSDGARNISKLSHLQWVSENPTSWTWDFELDNDIDASDTKNWNGGAGFSPIGNDEKEFKGIFDGNSHIINYLYINRPTLNHIGFFGKIANDACEIRNIRIENCEITGNSTVGALIGWNFHANISKCYSTGKVKSLDNYIGGLIGLNDFGIVNICYSKVDVTSDKLYAGGLIGKINKSNVKNCYALGTVTGKGIVGGLIGFNMGGILNNSYSNGNVNGSNNVGGLIGSANGGTVTHCFWDSQTSGQNNSKGGTAKSTLEMKVKISYTSWNFVTIWGIESTINEGYPFLNDLKPETKELEAPTLLSPSDNAENINPITKFDWTDIAVAISYNLEVSIDNSFTNKLIDEDISSSNFSVTNPLTIGNKYYWRVNATDGLDESDWSSIWSFTVNKNSSDSCVYEEPTDTDGNGLRNIKSICHLQWVSDNPTSWAWDFELDKDIDASDTKNWNGGGGFFPIGNDETEFSGVFDGNTYKISNLYINRPSTDYIGFFGKIENDSCEIKNLGIENCDITGNSIVGALVGWNFHSIISKCFSTGNINASDNYVGGLIGLNDFGEVNICYSSATITTTKLYAGGLIGKINKSSINNCYSYGTATGKGIVGGLVGFNMGANINNCYSIANVNGSSNIGGLIGSSNGGTANHCFWNIQTSGQSNSKGGMGKSTSEMKTKSLYTNWDFTKIWAIEADINDGYPYLLDLSPVSIKENHTKNSSQFLYPNPIHKGGIMRIKLNNPAVDFSIRIFNLEGILITEHRNKLYFPITNNFISGSYIIVIESDDEVVGVEKFIVK